MKSTKVTRLNLRPHTIQKGIMNTQCNVMMKLSSKKMAYFYICLIEE